ncbi:MAG: uncharacterized protein K0S33_1885 [Bacteroidetes bacterium]|jgi:hypothetical protein|nr:uncharacterized protein [Bacteroidota bacterium]
MENLSMKKIYFKYEFMVFLYAYLCQTDLSLDRSKWTTWAEVKDYYKLRLHPKKISDYIVKETKISETQIQYPCYLERELSLFSKLEYQLLKIRRKNNFLYTKEVYYCCQKLIEFENYLSQEQEPHKLEIEKLRVELSMFTFVFLQPRLFINDRNKAQHVEHYLQNEIFKDLHSVNDFIAGFEF